MWNERCRWQLRGNNPQSRWEVFVATTHETGSVQSYLRPVCGSSGEGGAGAEGGGAAITWVRQNIQCWPAAKTRCRVDFNVLSCRTADKLQNHSRNRKLTGRIQGSFVFWLQKVIRSWSCTYFLPLCAYKVAAPVLCYVLHFSFRASRSRSNILAGAAISSFPANVTHILVLGLHHVLFWNPELQQSHVELQRDHSHSNTLLHFTPPRALLGFLVEIHAHSGLESELIGACTTTVRF